jgi:hypothetical protein
MKLKIQILISFCVASLYSSAQVCPDILNNTTDPSNPQHYLGNEPGQNTYINLRPDVPPNTNPIPPNIPNVPKCNWLEDNFVWWAPGTMNTPIDNCQFESPFFTLSNDENLNGLYDGNPLLRDNRPEDGWELIVFNFGIRIDTDVVTNVSHPYLVLYNKHRGILRVFYYLSEPNFNEDYDLIRIKLDFMGTEEKESANFNHMEEVARPIDSYRKLQNENRANKVNNGLAPIINQNWCTAMWLYADFVMAYDPCVCEHTYDQFRIEVRATKTANVKLTGDLTTNEATKVDNGTLNGTANTTSNYKSGYKQVVGAAKEAKTYYKGGTEWLGFAAGTVGKIPPKKVTEITK